MNIKSKSFKSNENINIKYTGRGKGISPQLEWSDLPEGTKSLALFVHDPDAPIACGYWHGQVVDIPIEVNHVEEGAWNKLPGLIKNNDSDQEGYTPPMPPEGTGVHKYNFTIYALPFENINSFVKSMGMNITKESSRATTAFIVEMNKLGCATISFKDKFSK